MRHRPADAEQALLTASAIGAPPVEVAEVRADLMEAVGEHRAALDIRIADSGTLPQAQRLSRIVCSWRSARTMRRLPRLLPPFATTPAPPRSRLAPCC